MLDNLSLGYAGSAKGMYDLLTDAAKVSAEFREKANFSIDSKGHLTAEYKDIIEAIHIIQDDLNVTGTTAKEAATTIQGSWSATKAAFENVITAVGKGEGIEEAFQGVSTALFGTEDGEGLVNQLAPRLEKVFSSIGNLLNKALPEIKSQISPLIKKLIPTFSKAVVNLLNVIVKSLPDVLNTAKDLAIELLNAIGDELAEKVPFFENFGTKIEEAFTSVVTFLQETFSPTFDALKELFETVGEAIQPFIDKIIDIVTNEETAENTTNLLKGAIEGFANGLTVVTEKITDFVDWLNSGKTSADLFKAGLTGLTVALGVFKVATLASNASLGILAAQIFLLDVQEKALAISQGILNAVMNANPIVLIITLIAGLVAAVIYLWNTNEDFRNAVTKIFTAIKDKVTEVFEAWKFIFTEVIPQAIAFLVDKIKGFVNKIKTFFGDVKDAITLIFETIVSTITNKIQSIKAKFEAIFDFLKGAKDNALKWGSDMIDNFVKGITDKIDKVKDTVKNVASNVKDFLGFSEPKKGPLSNFHTYAPDMIDLFTKGIADNEYKITDQINKSFNIKPSLNGDKSLSIDYDELSEALIQGLKNVTMEVDGRDFARLAKKAVTYA
jgi:phage-related protein